MGVFVIRNQYRHYLGKHGEWLDGSHPPALFRTPHRDVAVNELIDHNIRDVELRGELLECEVDANGYPQVEVLNPIVAPAPDVPPDAPAPEASTAAESS